MIAMDDFQTFKKIMVKRNMELQMEAMSSLRSSLQRQDEESSMKDMEDADARVRDQFKMHYHYHRTTTALYYHYTALLYTVLH